MKTEFSLSTRYLILPLVWVALNGCSKENPLDAVIVPEVNPIVVEPTPVATATPAATPAATPSATATPGPTATPSPTPPDSPVPTPVPSATPYLSQRKSIRVEVSPKGTFGFDLRNWISNRLVRSSDKDLTVVEFDVSALSGFTKVLDARGRWVGITRATLASAKPGNEVKVPIVISNGEGKQLSTKVLVRIVKPYVNMPSNIAGFKIKRAAGRISLNLPGLYRRGVIRASTEAVLLGRYRTNLPLSRCSVLLTEDGPAGLICDKAELNPRVNYELNLEIKIAEGATYRKVFGLFVTDAQTSSTRAEEEVSDLEP